MKNRPSTPLLRVAAMAASMVSCSTPALGEDAPDAPEAPAPSRLADPTQSKLYLRGTIEVPEDAEQTVYLEITTSAGTKRIDIPKEGPWPRPFQLTDADLEGQGLDGDSVRVVMIREQEGHNFSHKGIYTLPLHASGVALRAYTAFIGPVPASEIPTRAEVMAMDPAAPDEPGSALDLEGVIVFDNGWGIPQRVGVSVRGKTGVLHKNFVPTASPFRFRLQDSDVLEGHPFTGETVELWVKVRYGSTEHTAIEQTLTLPTKSKGIIALPVEYTPPEPAPSKLVAKTIAIQGVVKRPKGVNVKDVVLVMHHGVGTITKPLPLGRWPLAFHLAGPEFEDIPLLDNTKTVLISVAMTLEEGTELYATLNVPFQSKNIVLKPEPLPLRPIAPEEPVYGNTKGSRYDGR